LPSLFAVKDLTIWGTVAENCRKCAGRGIADPQQIGKVCSCDKNFLRKSAEILRLLFIVRTNSQDKL